MHFCKFHHSVSNFSLLDTIKQSFDNEVTPYFAMVICIWGRLLIRKSVEFFLSILTVLWMIKFLCAVLGTIFLEFWKRAENSWAFLWDVTDYEINEPDRPEFYGTTTETVSKIAYSFNSYTKNCIKS